jgi:flagellar hook-associated protein 3 FlgL
MRITTNMTYQNSTRALQKASERLDKASEQMTTGDKFATAGEDPTGMAQKLSLTSKITAFQQYSTNGSLLDSSLTLEGTILDSVTTNLQSAYTLTQKSVNGAMSATDKKSIASELEQLQSQLYDLMNSKNADGEYIFGGNQSQTQPFVKNDAGDYEFKGDTGQRMIQVAPSVQIAANDSGLSVFQSEFDSFFRNQYDFTTPANNIYTISTTASPDQYLITGNNGYSQTGDYIPGEAINFNGISLTMAAAAGSGPAQQFTLDAPTNDNVLNSLNTMIDKLKNSSTLTDEEWASTIADVQTHINNTLDRVGIIQGAVGGRQNNLDQIMNSNSSLQTITSEAKANVSEIDLYEAISNVFLQENALTMAQQAFAKVNKSTLFDYL